MGKDTAFEVFAKRLAHIGLWGAAVALPTELTCTGEVKPGLVVCGYRNKPKRAAKAAVGQGKDVTATNAAAALQRTVTVRVPSFLSVPYLLATSDLIATVPERLAQQAIRFGGAQTSSGSA